MPKPKFVFLQFSGLYRIDVQFDNNFKINNYSFQRKSGFSNWVASGGLRGSWMNHEYTRKHFISLVDVHSEQKLRHVMNSIKQIFLAVELCNKLNIPHAWTTYYDYTNPPNEFIESQEGGFAGLTEIIIGTKLEFENEPDIGIATQEIFGTDLNTSLGGVEYANKRHEPKTTFQLNFSNISQTFKNNLVSFEQDVTNFKKFVYYDDSTYHYVRLDSPIKFTEVAFQRFSASLKLREQLS